MELDNITKTALIISAHRDLLSVLLLNLSETKQNPDAYREGLQKVLRDRGARALSTPEHHQDLAEVYVSELDAVFKLTETLSRQIKEPSKE